MLGFIKGKITYKGKFSKHQAETYFPFFISTLKLDHHNRTLRHIFLQWNAVIQQWKKLPCNLVYDKGGISKKWTKKVFIK